MAASKITPLDVQGTVVVERGEDRFVVRGAGAGFVLEAPSLRALRRFRQGGDGQLLGQVLPGALSTCGLPFRVMVRSHTLLSAPASASWLGRALGIRFGRLHLWGILRAMFG